MNIVGRKLGIITCGGNGCGCDGERIMRGGALGVVFYELPKREEQSHFSNSCEMSVLVTTLFGLSESVPWCYHVDGPT